MNKSENEIKGINFYNHSCTLDKIYIYKSVITIRFVKGKF